mmetsp:Transcript_16055/g.31210  ORF Transcript_16055/g.31210 Transcript_16055/m.31210 type:complete len:99 (-) Transcript_16055:27-323(-)
MIQMLSACHATNSKTSRACAALLVLLVVAVVVWLDVPPQALSAVVTGMVVEVLEAPQGAAALPLEDDLVPMEAFVAWVAMQLLAVGVPYASPPEDRAG